MIRHGGGGGGGSSVIDEAGSLVAKVSVVCVQSGELWRLGIDYFCCPCLYSQVRDGIEDVVPSFVLLGKSKDPSSSDRVLTIRHSAVTHQTTSNNTAMASTALPQLALPECCVCPRGASVTGYASHQWIVSYTWPL